MENLMCCDVDSYINIRLKPSTSSIIDTYSIPARSYLCYLAIGYLFITITISIQKPSN